MDDKQSPTKDGVEQDSIKMNIMDKSIDEIKGNKDFSKQIINMFECPLKTEEYQNINSLVNEEQPLIDHQQQFDTCDKQIFQEDFENSHPEACIYICNTINQYTKANIKAILSKEDKFILVSEVQNDSEQFVQKYQQNIMKIVNTFIKQNTPSKEIIEQCIDINQKIVNTSKKQNTPSKEIIELGIKINQNQNYEDEDEDEDDDNVSDSIFKNIDQLRRKLKELNKLM